MRRLTAWLTGACLLAAVAPAVASAAASPPTIAGAFTPSSIAVGGTSSLGVTISNPNSSSSLSGISFTDTLPSGVVVDNPNGENGSCGSSSVVTANPGSNSISLSGGSLSGGASCTISVNVTSSAPGAYQNNTGRVSSTNGGSGNSDTESLTVVGPPKLSVRTPRNRAVYKFGQRVRTSFSCQDAANAPGLSDCSGTVDDTGDNLTSGQFLPTKVAGRHTLTVSATSSDGQVVSDTIDYTVKPDNHFTISHAGGSSNGLSFQVKLPGPGRLKVSEIVGGATVGSEVVKVGKAGKRKVTVRGQANPGSVARLVITYTPKAGVGRKVTVSGIRLH